MRKHADANARAMQQQKSSGRRRRKRSHAVGFLFVLVLLALTAVAVNVFWPGRFFPRIPFFGGEGPARTQGIVTVPIDFASVQADPDRFRILQNLLLVNGDYGLPDNFAADVAPYKDTDVLMNRAMLDDYARLSSAVSEQTGERMYVMSLLRGRDLQAELHAEDPVFAQKPGHSEHETGLAADVYVVEFAGAHFINSQAGKFVAASAWEYGFIIRYPEGKEDITGIPYEAWHLRYVGPLHAAAMHSRGQVLEEYILSFDPGRWYRYADHLISRQPLGSPLEIPSTAAGPIEVSPDNTGHVILTVPLKPVS